MAKPAPILDAPVHQVHLFEDRATVFRSVQLSEVGRVHITLDGLTPLIQERTVACTGEGLLVEDVQVHRQKITREQADDAEMKALAESLEAAQDRLDKRIAERQRAEDARQRAETRRDTARALFPRALAGPDSPEDWLAALKTVHEAVVDATVRAATLHGEVDGLKREVQVLHHRLQEARAGSHVMRSQLVLQVLVETPGTLQIRYTIPCALWRPVHRAELQGEALSWETGALIWNATGESWRGVQLVCSTARPGDHAAPPPLDDDLIRVIPRNSKALAVEVREELLTEARVGAPVARGEVGVDDGGETRTFTAPSPIDLPSDGRPVHVALERWSDTARSVWLGHGERASEIVLRSTQKKRGSGPLLAGPVNLIRDGIAVGRGEVPLVVPGEAFHLGWGSHDGLRVVRRRDQETERGRISGRQTQRFRVELKVTQTGDSSTRFRLVERIPISEVTEVSVSAPVAEPPLSSGPDGDGFCFWELELAPGEIRLLTLSFTVEAASHVHISH